MKHFITRKQMCIVKSKQWTNSGVSIPKTNLEFDGNWGVLETWEEKKHVIIYQVGFLPSKRFRIHTHNSECGMVRFLSCQEEACFMGWGVGTRKATYQTEYCSPTFAVCVQISVRWSRSQVEKGEGRTMDVAFKLFGVVCVWFVEVGWWN